MFVLAATPCCCRQTIKFPLLTCPLFAAEIQHCLVSAGDVGCGVFECFENNSCEIRGLQEICMTFLHNAGKFDSQVPPDAAFLFLFLLCCCFAKIIYERCSVPSLPPISMKTTVHLCCLSSFKNLSIFLEAQLCIHAFCNLFSSLGVFTSLSLGQRMYSSDQRL